MGGGHSSIQRTPMETPAVPVAYAPVATEPPKPIEATKVSVEAAAAPWAQVLQENVGTGAPALVQVTAVHVSEVSSEVTGTVVSANRAKVVGVRKRKPCTFEGCTTASVG